MKQVIGTVFMLMLVVLPVFAQQKSINWVQETAKASWRPRDSQGEFVYKNAMWILGGWDTPQTPNFLDVWKSSDGKNWVRTLETAPWVQGDLPVSLAFKNKMWIMGGRKVPGSECSNKVWSSTDGAQWKLVTSNAGWSPRLGAGFVVFKNKMWVLGGTSDFYHNNDSTMMNDVWSSSDGKQWKLETANAGWSKRAYAQAVVFDNKIWIMGGGRRAPDPAVAVNDVWCSEDGVHWTEVTPSAQWNPRLWFSLVEYRNMMWVLGGWSDKNHNFGDVWYSKDGKEWVEFKSDTCWSGRHEHSAFVFRDKIWVAGGAAEPNYKLNSEVWSLFIPKEWTPPQSASSLKDHKKISAERTMELYEKGFKEDPWLRHPDAATLAWGEFYTLQALVDLYEATGNRQHLDEVAFRGNRMLSHRDDKRGVPDGSGKSRPAWSMGQDFVTAEAHLLDAAGKPVIEFRSTTFDYNNSTQVELRSEPSSRFTIVVSNERKKRTETFINLSVDQADDRYIEKVVNDPMAPPQAKAGNYTDKSHLLRVTKVHRGRQPKAQSLNLSPIPLAFMGYTGIIYDPLMRFAEIVKNSQTLSDLLPVANNFIQAAEETYQNASARLWRDGPGKQEGYYLCSEKGESFPWDNVGLPFNFLAKHVCTELALYRLTGKKEYLDRSEKMIHLFKNRLQFRAENDTYSWDYWYEPVTTIGWKPSDSISENIRFLKPFGGPEDISHGSITISLVDAAYQAGIGFDKKDMARFANTLLKLILNIDSVAVSSDVAGRGKGQEYFPQLYGYLGLTEGNPQVYHAIREAYLKWDGERFPFTAALLKWERKISSVAKK